MKKQIFEIDKDGYWIRDVQLYPIGYGDEEVLYEYPDYYTEIKPPTEIQPFWRPRWTGTEWIEDMSKEEIDELNKPQPTEPTLEERNRADIEYLAIMMEVDL